MFQLEDLQACAPESLPVSHVTGQGLDDYTLVHLGYDLDSMGFNRVTLRSPSRESLIKTLLEFWGDDDATGGWTTEQYDRITKE